MRAGQPFLEGGRGGHVRSEVLGQRKRVLHGALPVLLRRLAVERGRFALRMFGLRMFGIGRISGLAVGLDRRDGLRCMVLGKRIGVRGRFSMRSLRPEQDQNQNDGQDAGGKNRQGANGTQCGP